MPFKSKAQQRAAFSGALGPEMKAKALEFARATPNLKSLPEHVGDRRRARARSKRSKQPSKRAIGRYLKSDKR